MACPARASLGPESARRCGMTLSRVIQTVPASPIGAMFNRAAALRAKGVDLIDLSLGEPDFDTPNHIHAACIAAISAGITRYTAADGGQWR